MTPKTYGLFIVTSLFLSIGGVSASMTGSQSSGSLVTWKQRIVTNKTISKTTTPANVPLLTLAKFFTDVCLQAGDGIPVVYKDIHIIRPGVKKNTALYDALQKCVYLGVLEPRSKITNLSFTPSGNFVYDFFAQKFHIFLTVALPGDETVPVSNWEDHILDKIPSYSQAQKILQASARGSNGSYTSEILKSPFFNALSTAYTALKQNYHYLSGSADDETLIYGGVQGMLDSLHDKYSVYFPPENANTFLTDIQGEYQGVGAYVDVIDGKFTFVGLVSGSPAMEAGIQPGDHVISVDGWIVPEVFTLKEVIGRIKGPAGTKVVVTVERNGATIQFTMERKKLSIPLMEIKKKNNNLIFAISSFGKGLDSQFALALDTYKQDISSAKNIIIDLRNNGGGYVDVVNNIMNYFVASGQVLLQYEYKNGKEKIVSQGPVLSPFADKNIIILINGGTASASEILAGVIKDYYPTSKLVGQKTYGKGSMQSLERLPNGGSFKYTLALRYIGKSGLSVEKNGLKPDVEMIDNPKTVSDEIMDTVLTR